MVTVNLEKNAGTSGLRKVLREECPKDVSSILLDAGYGRSFALTTFLSLAGRYCVLMPNSANSGGISKKIPFKTRKKMRDIINAINIPEEMSMILRTAGSLKTKAEIKRDYDNLIKLWNEIANYMNEFHTTSQTTKNSTATETRLAWGRNYSIFMFLI